MASATKIHLYSLGCDRMKLFCERNKLKVPKAERISPEKWGVSHCAYYRQDLIRICIERCAGLAPDAMSASWSWPGSTVDREPFGVLCHELGHHVDFYCGTTRGRYSSEYSEMVMTEADEEPLTGYSPNPAEWFAEMFRLFVTNHALLKLVRPRTHKVLSKRWKPVSDQSWTYELNKYCECPTRIVESNRKKILAAG